MQKMKSSSYKNNNKDMNSLQSTTLYLYEFTSINNSLSLRIHFNQQLSISTMLRSSLLSFLVGSFLFLNLVEYGSAKGKTSTYVRENKPTEDIPLDDQVFAVPRGHNAPQQVHITQGDYDGKAVIISWVTADEPGCSTVQYGTSRKVYNFIANGSVNTYNLHYGYTSGFIHHCLLDDLKYNTKYYYKIGSGDSSRQFWFQTPPKIDPDAPYKFGIIGDLGQTYHSLSTLEHYMQSRAHAVLFVGDLSYADHYFTSREAGLRWDTWGRLVERSAAYQPWIWSAGNHDMDYWPDLEEVVPFKSYLHRYATPHLASKSISPLWYSIRRASAHIIVLSSYSPFVEDTPQNLWLQGELKRVDREQTPWLIVLMHIPIYNSNEKHFKEGESMRAAFEEFFVHYRVDVVFAGHVHAYERSYRISNTNGCYPIQDKNAPIYITVGDGGNKEGLAGRFKDPQPNYSAFREASYGHSTLEILNRTHALLNWNCNDNGKKVARDSIILHNLYNHKM